MNIYRDDNGNIIDYYQVLNIPYMAGKEMIRTAFCNLVKLYHPDISGRDSEEDRRKIHLIIDGYKTLIDEKARADYNRQLSRIRKINSEGYLIVPKSRIRYSMSLKDLLTKRLLAKDIKRKDRIYNFGQDVEIFLTYQESRRGAVALIELPTRMNCYVCYGEDPYCHACRGVGRVHGASKLEVRINPGTASGTTLDVDLIKARPDRFTVYTMKALRIKIIVIPAESQRKKIKSGA